MSTLLLADAKIYLNITVTTYDTELQAFIDAAEAMIGQRCGPIASTAKTVRIAGGTGCLALPTTPVISLTSVTPNSGAALTLADLYVDPVTGVVEYNNGTGFSARYYTVVYAAGRSTCPTDLLMAVKELLRHMWTTQRGRTGPQSAEAMPGSAHALPWRVTELIAPHVQLACG